MNTHKWQTLFILLLLSYLFCHLNFDKIGTLMCILLDCIEAKICIKTKLYRILKPLILIW